MSRLLTLGCSWSDPNFFSWMFPDLDTSWPKWPEIVAKEFDLELKNLGRGGSGNDYAFKYLIDEVYSDNPPEYIIWQLTQWSRMLLGDYRLMNASRLEMMSWHADARKTNPRWIWGINNLPVAMQGPDVWIENTLYYIEKAIRICREKNIKLFIFQADYPPWPRHFWPYILKKKEEDPELFEWFLDFIGGEHKLENQNFTDDNVYKMLDNKHFRNIIDLDPKEIYGWPLWSELGGKQVSISKNGEKQIIPEDGHPNAQGQEIMAETVIENIKQWFEKK